MKPTVSPKPGDSTTPKPVKGVPGHSKAMSRILAKLMGKRGPPTETDMKRQFQEIEAEGRKKELEAKRLGQFKSASEHPEKNRYNNILPFENTRVKIKGGEDFYINASVIKFTEYPDHQYIATQGPLKETREDFWAMVWAERIKSIVMLAKQVELGKEKCAKYWPGKAQPTEEYGPYVVTLKGKEEKNGFVVRTFELKNKNQEGQTHTVKQFHYKAWPDFGIPAQNEELLDLIRAVRDWNDDGASPVVHCSAGVGRTGTYCAIDVGLTAKQRNKDVNSEIPKLVREMRASRPGMVQSEDQYLLCFRALNDPKSDQYLSSETSSRKSNNPTPTNSPSPRTE
eukprot:comp22188_c0_seq1/m.32603 comp22188_c0_seq1/g.32603  ORF comp22188_c0_seq1/g.32603 comp22188_c0_seq1/m.32603 type:complete len:340 (-) comp22188_c0_seq1:641-1660(-)